ADLAAQRLRLGCAEEVTVEQQLEDAAVLLGLRDRRGERLTKVVLLLPRDRLKRLERVEDLRAADRHALAPELLAERDQARRQTGGWAADRFAHRVRRALIPTPRLRCWARPASTRLVRRPGPFLSGA